MHRKVVCAGCPRQVIPGREYRDAGKTYCSRTCQEFNALKRIEQGVRRHGGMGFALAIVLFVAVAPRHSQAHEPYSGWTIPGQSKSCCNQTDCAVTRAKFERGNWWAFVASKKIWVQVPDDRIVRYTTEDADAHLCYGETWGEVYCFRPPKLGM